MDTTKRNADDRALAAWLAAATVLYTLAAWMVAPGFYDCCGPPTSYAFTCPPHVVGAIGGPKSGHLVINVANGVSEPNSVYTEDGQVVIGILSGAFDALGTSTITVDIAPVTPCPNPSGLTFVTNTYHVIADAPLVHEATLVMQYSNLLPAPSYVYRADSLDGPWTNIGASSQARLWTINVKTDKLGYFAAGYPSSATSPAGGNQILPFVVAALIAGVLVAGIPVAIVRRRNRSTPSILQRLE